MSEPLTRDDVVAAVKEALGNHPCRYTALTPQQLDHVVGMLTDIGDGDLRRGVEIVRTNHKWILRRAEHDAEYAANHDLVSSVRRNMGGVGGHIAKGIAWALVVALAVLLLLGVKAYILKIPTEIISK